MSVIDDKLIKGIEKAADTVLKHSERWSIGQKLVAFAVCLLAGAALVSGADKLRVAAGVAVALYGVAFLTLHRRTVESQTIVLKDQSGKPRISISAENGIVFFDANQHAKIALNLSEGGQPILLMRDDHEQINVAVTENGAAIALAGMDLAEAGVKLFRQSVVVGPSDGASVTLLGGSDRASVVLAQSNAPQLHLSSSQSGTSMHLANGKGASVRLQASGDGHLGVLLVNEENNSTATLGSVGTGAHLSFFGEEHIPVARYPDDKALEAYAHAVAQRRKNAG